MSREAVISSFANIFERVTGLIAQFYDTRILHCEMNTNQILK